jgi:rubrerythrin
MINFKLAQKIARSGRYRSDPSPQELADAEAEKGWVKLRGQGAPVAEPEAEKSLPALSALAELTKSKPIPLPTSGKASSIASMRAAQGVDSEGNAKKAEQIPGGLASGKSPSDFPAEALSAGVKVELEHTKDAKVAREIAMDHLTEDPAYYEKLARMEGEAKEKSMATEDTGLNGLAQFAGAEPLEKGVLDAPAPVALEAPAAESPQTHLVKGIDCNHQPREALAHAYAVVNARVRAERDAGVTLGVPGPAPAVQADQDPAGVAYLSKGGEMVPFASRADQEAAELVKSGEFNHAEPPRFPTTNLVGWTCPKCGGHLIKALTACPHCNAGHVEQPIITERQERPEPPAVRTTGPLLQPARQVTVDARNGLSLTDDE